MKLQNQQFKELKELQDKQNKLFTAKIEAKLDDYLRDENDETFFDDEIISRK